MNETLRLCLGVFDRLELVLSLGSHRSCPDRYPNYRLRRIVFRGFVWLPFCIEASTCQFSKKSIGEIVRFRVAC
jgi:hypothetical protein